MICGDGFGVAAIREESVAEGTDWHTCERAAGPRKTNRPAAQDDATDRKSSLRRDTPTSVFVSSAERAPRSLHPAADHQTRLAHRAAGRRSHQAPPWEPRHQTAPRRGG
jgi:hypothetical protein